MAQNSPAPVMERMQPEILMRSLAILMANDLDYSAPLTLPPLGVVWLAHEPEPGVDRAARA